MSFFFFLLCVNSAIEMEEIQKCDFSVAASHFTTQFRPILYTTDFSIEWSESSDIRNRYRTLIMGSLIQLSCIHLGERRRKKSSYKIKCICTCALYCLLCGTFLPYFFFLFCSSSWISVCGCALFIYFVQK